MDTASQASSARRAGRASRSGHRKPPSRFGTRDNLGALKVDIEGAEAVIFAENYETWIGSVEIIVTQLHDDSKFGDASGVFERAIADRGSPSHSRAS